MYSVSSRVETVTSWEIFNTVISVQSSSGLNTLWKSVGQLSKAAWKISHHLSTFRGLRSSSEQHLNSSLTERKKQTRTETILLRSEEVMIRVGAGDLNVHLTVEFPQGRGAHHPFLFPPSAIYTHTHTHTHTHTTCHTHTDTRVHTVWECWGK